jgi:hypothetical protein
MHTYMARTALECTSETGSDQAGFDHGVGHSLLLLYDAKAPLGKKNYEFNSL